MENKDLGNTSMGIKANMAALLSYALGWVSGLVIFLLEKENKFVRFHAMQSIVVFGALNLLQVILPIIFSMFGIFSGVVFITQLFGYAGLVLWIVLLIKAYQGEKFKLPIAGDIAEQNSK